MLLGRIARQEEPYWSADVEAIRAYTQGTSLDDAIDMLASLIRLQVDCAGFEVTITKVGVATDGATLVCVDSNLPLLLAEYMLLCQRDLAPLADQPR